MATKRSNQNPRIISKAKIAEFKTALQNEYGSNRDAQTAARLAIDCFDSAAAAIAANDVNSFIDSVLNGGIFHDEARMANRGLSLEECKRRNKAATNMLIYGNIEGIA